MGRISVAVLISLQIVIQLFGDLFFVSAEYGSFCQHQNETLSDFYDKMNASFSSSASAEDSSQDYGTSMEDNNMNSCNFEEGLCIENKCECRVPSMMIYSERLDACGAPTGSLCNRNLTCLLGNVCKDNICTCPESTVALPDGGCSAARFEPCSRDTDCNSQDFLACYEGLCDCKNSRKSIFQTAAFMDEQLVGEGCKIRAGEMCTPMGPSEIQSQPCVMNAECSNVEGSNEILDLPNDMSRTECICRDGYTLTPDGSCRKDFAQPCTTKLEECNSNSGLMCKNNACVCIDDDTIYDRDQRACVSFVGESCGGFPLWYESYEIGCTKNAECLLVGKEELGGRGDVGKMGHLRSCKCKAGYEESMEKEGRTCIPTTTSKTAFQFKK